MMGIKLTLINTAVAFLSVFQGCSQPERLIRQKLTGNSTLFWDIYDRERGYVKASYSFSENGSWFYYLYKDGKRTRMPKGDMVYPDTWTIEKDSVLNLGGFKQKILKFDHDTLILLSERRIDTTLLIKAKNP